MLTKLLKYDLKYMIKNMCVFYILSIFFAITTRLLFEVEQSVMINIITINPNTKNINVSKNFEL